MTKKTSDHTDEEDQQDQIDQKIQKDQVLDSLADTLRKQTGIHPVVNSEEEKPGLWDKLKGLFGN